VEINIDPESSGRFAIRIRVPGWVRNEAIPGSLYKFGDRVDENFSITLNGNRLIYSGSSGSRAVSAYDTSGYLTIERIWEKGDRIALEFPMPVRTVIADERVRDDSGKLAVQRGPVIYCAEWPDNDGKVFDLSVDNNPAFETEFVPDLLGGIRIIKSTAARTVKPEAGNRPVTVTKTPLTLIPYALWNNRGPGQMRVWLPVNHFND